jgi:hypothetical protein
LLIWGYAQARQTKNIMARIITSRRVCTVIKKVLTLALLLFASLWVIVACGFAGGGPRPPVQMGSNSGYLPTSTQVAPLL